jgi:hypothetical protein
MAERFFILNAIQTDRQKEKCSWRSPQRSGPKETRRLATALDLDASVSLGRDQTTRRTA